jgi:hypothetical protein
MNAVKVESIILVVQLSCVISEDEESLLELETKSALFVCVWKTKGCVVDVTKIHVEVNGQSHNSL